MTHISKEEARRRKRKTFTLLFIITFSITSILGIYIENAERVIHLSDNEIEYNKFDSSANEYVFHDQDGQEVILKGNYKSKKSIKTMTYDGHLYQIKVDTELNYVLYEDDVIIDVFTPVEYDSDKLQESNEIAYLIYEAFYIISFVESNLIYKMLMIQLVLIITTSAVFSYPKYFWEIGYFKRKFKVQPSGFSLGVIRVESIFIALVIMFFPLLRLIF